MPSQHHNIEMRSARGRLDNTFGREGGAATRAFMLLDIEWRRDLPPRHFARDATAPVQCYAYWEYKYHELAHSFHHIGQGIRLISRPTFRRIRRQKSTADEIRRERIAGHHFLDFLPDKNGRAPRLERCTADASQKLLPFSI